jgi:class 3 adenylate cyclase
MDFQKLLDSLLPSLGQVGVDALAQEFQGLSEGQGQPWKKAALSLLAEAVETHGVAGVALAQKAIHDLFEDKVPMIDWASPRTASDIVAALQNAEADTKSAANDFFVKLGGSLGKILSGLIKGLMS